MPSARSLAGRAARDALGLVGWNEEPALRPVLVVTLAGSIAGGLLWVFVAIWAKQRLHASDAALSVALLAGALLSAVGGTVGGHLSDRYGRRPLMLTGWGCQAIVPLAYLAVGTRTAPGLGLVSLAGLFGSLGRSATDALVADLVSPARREHAYGAVRVANNLGITIGPPLGGLLLLGDSWPRLLVGAAIASAAAFAVAVRVVPRVPPLAHAGRSARAAAAVLARDRACRWFLAFTVLAALTYATSETVLPISLTDAHGISPSTWGVLLIINPALVTLLQLRVMRRTAGIPAAVRLALAMAMMGLPYLVLTATSAIPAVAALIVVFVFGEMLWAPTASAVAARLARPETRGATMGATNAAFAAGMSLTPLIGLQVRGAAGDDAMWTLFAGLALVAGATGFTACALAFGWRAAPVAEPS